MGFTYSLQIFNTFFSFLWVNNENLAKKAEKQTNFEHFLAVKLRFGFVEMGNEL